MSERTGEDYLTIRRMVAMLRLIERDYNDDGTFESGATTAVEAVQAARILGEEAIAAAERTGTLANMAFNMKRWCWLNGRSVPS